jgi:N-acetylmuramoyl-L-alanine amidase
MVKAKDYLIALCDGHGSDTPGKRTPAIPTLKGRVIHENEFNKAVIKFLDEELRRCGFRTLLVAPTDADTPLKARTDLANAKGADAYISVHYDALDSKFDGEGKDPEGHTVFVYKGQRGKASGKLAECVHKYLVQGTPQKDRGIKEADFHVLRETHMVAILTENGFMDNLKEAVRMIDPKFQKECAVEHAKGICEYFKVEYVPYVAPKPPAPKPATPNPVSKPSKEIHKVQVGAFGDKANAQELADRLKKLGFPTVIVSEDK